LFVGILVNQFHGQGIRWRILLLSVPTGSKQTEVAHVSVDSAFTLFTQSSAVFVDIRLREDFEIDHIQGALPLPLFDFFTNPAPFKRKNRDATYILYDFERHSKKVRLTARQLSKYGFKKVIVLHGGFAEWLERSLPVESGGEF